MRANGFPSGLDPDDQLAAIGQAVITTDLDGVVVYWNRAAERLYGWTAEEAVGRNISTLTVPEISQDVAAEIMAALRDGVSWSGGFPVRRKDGSVFSALVTDAGVYHDGRLCGIVGVSAHLGTALRPLLDRSSDAALVISSAGVVTYASPAVQRLFGWDEDAVVGSSADALLHPEDRRALADLFTRILKEPGQHLPLELRVRQGDGWIWAEATFTNLLDDPVVRGVVCNLRVASRRIEQEEALLRARQLQTALDSRLVIEQAKGYLAGRDGGCVSESFERLRKHARDNHLPIREVARRVLGGELALPPVSGSGDAEA